MDLAGSEHFQLTDLPKHVHLCSRLLDRCSETWYIYVAGYIVLETRWATVKSIRRERKSSRSPTEKKRICQGRKEHDNAERKHGHHPQHLETRPESYPG